VTEWTTAGDRLQAFRATQVAWAGAGWFPFR